MKHRARRHSARLEEGISQAVRKFVHAVKKELRKSPNVICLAYVSVGYIGLNSVTFV